LVFELLSEMLGMFFSETQCKQTNWISVSLLCRCKFISADVEVDRWRSRWARPRRHYYACRK